MNKLIEELLVEPGVWLAFYLLVAINTFGHCWANLAKNPLANDGGLMVGSFVSALFWPLYWSVKFWS